VSFPKTFHRVKTRPDALRNPADWKPAAATP